MIALYAIVVTRASRTAGPSDPILAAALRGELDEPGARQLSNRGPEVTTLALLALARRIAELQSQARTGHHDFASHRDSLVSLADPVTSGGLIDAWRRLAAVLTETLKIEVQSSKNRGFLSIGFFELWTSIFNVSDETGRRVEGQTHWLWCFANHTVCTIYRTLKLRGHNPTQTIAAALQTYITIGKLPPLPGPAIANG